MAEKYYRTENKEEIEKILTSKSLGTPKALRFKGNAVEKNSLWDFDLKIICICDKGEYEEGFYISMGKKTKVDAIANIKLFITDMQNSKMFKRGFVDMNTGKMVEKL